MTLRQAVSSASAVYGTLLLLGVLSCGSRAQSETAERERVLFAVGQLRQADNAGKPALLKLLEVVPVTTPEARRVKEGCVEAYRLHVGTLAEIAAVRASIPAQGDIVGPVRSVLVARAKNAESQMERARELTHGCAELEAELRARHGGK